MKPVVPGLTLMTSKLGWILTGRVKCQEPPSAPSLSMLIHTTSPISTHPAAWFNAQKLPTEHKLLLKDFGKLATLGISEPVCVNDDGKALRKFNDTIRFEDGRYEVSLPWKKEPPSLPTNYELTVGKLRSLVNRLMKNPEHLTKYDAIIQDQLQKDITEFVRDEKSTNRKGNTSHTMRQSHARRVQQRYKMSLMLLQKRETGVKVWMKAYIVDQYYLRICVDFWWGSDFTK